MWNYISNYCDFYFAGSHKSYEPWCNVTRKRKTSRGRKLLFRSFEAKTRWRHYTKQPAKIKKSSSTKENAQQKVAFVEFRPRLYKFHVNGVLKQRLNHLGPLYRTFGLSSQYISDVLKLMQCQFFTLTPHVKLREVFVFSEDVWWNHLEWGLERDLEFRLITEYRSFVEFLIWFRKFCKYDAMNCFFYKGTSFVLLPSKSTY